MTAVLERELGTGEYLLPSAEARAAALARAAARCRGVLAPSRVWKRPDAVVAFAVPVVPGASLAELAAESALTLGECVAVGVGVAEALAAMHAERLAHGDVTAANVVAHGRTVTLVDTMGALADGGGASPEGDIAALGTLLRVLANPQAAPAIEAWTAPLLADDPAERPEAAHAAAALALCAPPEQLRKPVSPVAAAIRSGALPRTAARRQDRWWRAERTAKRLSPLAALAVVGTFAGVGLMPAVAEGEGPQQAAVVLTERRIAALAAGDAQALVELTVPDTEAAAANPDRLDPFVGLAAQNISAEVISESETRAVVKVTSRLSGYSVGLEEHPPATVTAVLELSLTRQGWLVGRVLPAP